MTEDRTERPPPKLAWLLLAASGTFGSFRWLRHIGASFAAATSGHAPFDFQDRLTVRDIKAQLPAYTPASKALYRRFFVADLVFPLVASTFLALVWASLLRRPTAPSFARRLPGWTPAWLFLPTLFDYGENLSFLVLIERWPRPSPVPMRAGVVFKRLKLASLLLAGAGTAALGLARCWSWGARLNSGLWATPRASRPPGSRRGPASRGGTAPRPRSRRPK